MLDFVSPSEGRAPQDKAFGDISLFGVTRTYKNTKLRNLSN